MAEESSFFLHIIYENELVLRYGEEVASLLAKKPMTLPPHMESHLPKNGLGAGWFPHNRRYHNYSRGGAFQWGMKQFIDATGLERLRPFFGESHTFSYLRRDEENYFEQTEIYTILTDLEIVAEGFDKLTAWCRQNSIKAASVLDCEPEDVVSSIDNAFYSTAPFLETHLGDEGYGPHCFFLLDQNLW